MSIKFSKMRENALLDSNAFGQISRIILLKGEGTYVLGPVWAVHIKFNKKKEVEGSRFFAMQLG